MFTGTQPQNTAILTDKYVNFYFFTLLQLFGLQMALNRGLVYAQAASVFEVLFCVRYTMAAWAQELFSRKAGRHSWPTPGFPFIRLRHQVWTDILYQSFKRLLENTSREACGSVDANPDQHGNQVGSYFVIWANLREIKE